MSIYFGTQRYDDDDDFFFTPCEDANGNCTEVQAEHEVVIEKLENDNEFLKSALANEKAKLNKCSAEKREVEREMKHIRVLGDVFSQDDESPNHSNRVPSKHVHQITAPYPILTRGVTRMG